MFTSSPIALILNTKPSSGELRLVCRWTPMTENDQRNPSLGIHSDGYPAVYVTSCIRHSGRHRLGTWFRNIWWAVRHIPCAFLRPVSSLEIKYWSPSNRTDEDEERGSAAVVRHSNVPESGEWTDRRVSWPCFAAPNGRNDCTENGKRKWILQSVFACHYPSPSDLSYNSKVQHNPDTVINLNWIHNLHVSRIAVTCTKHPQ